MQISYNSGEGFRHCTKCLVNTDMDVLGLSCHICSGKLAVEKEKSLTGANASGGGLFVPRASVVDVMIFRET